MHNRVYTALSQFIGNTHRPLAGVADLLVPFSIKMYLHNADIISINCLAFSSHENCLARSMPFSLRSARSKASEAIRLTAAAWSRGGEGFTRAAAPPATSASAPLLDAMTGSPACIA